ncbi:MAG: flagellar biosynthetic protein FliO [Candidatus Latescibacterota bacterium]
MALGVTEGQINALSEWQAGELELTVETESAGSFATQFKKLLKSEPQEGRDT